jgi:hypothetical protein
MLSLEIMKQFEAQAEWECIFMINEKIIAING